MSMSLLAGLEARARRARHLVTRSFDSLRARSLDDATTVWLATTL